MIAYLIGASVAMIFFNSERGEKDEQHSKATPVDRGSHGRSAPGARAGKTGNRPTVKKDPDPAPPKEETPAEEEKAIEDPKPAPPKEETPAEEETINEEPKGETDE